MQLLKFCKSNFATKLQASSTKNKSTAKGKRYGLKKFEFGRVYPLDVLVTQKGLKFKPGLNTYYGRDGKIIAACEGVVRITKQFEDRRSGSKKITILHVLPHQQTMSPKIFPGVYNYHPEQYPELAKFNSEPYIYELPKPNPQPMKKPFYQIINENFDAKNIRIPEEYKENWIKEQSESETMEQMEKHEKYQYLSEKRINEIKNFVQYLNK